MRVDEPYRWLDAVNQLGQRTNGDLNRLSAESEPDGVAIRRALLQFQEAQQTLWDERQTWAQRPEFRHPMLDAWQRLAVTGMEISRAWDNADKTAIANRYKFALQSMIDDAKKVADRGRVAGALPPVASALLSGAGGIIALALVAYIAVRKL